MFILLIAIIVSIFVLMRNRSFQLQIFGGIGLFAITSYFVFTNGLSIDNIGLLLSVFSLKFRAFLRNIVEMFKLGLINYDNFRISFAIVSLYMTTLSYNLHNNIKKLCKEEPSKDFYYPWFAASRLGLHYDFTIITIASFATILIRSMFGKQLLLLTIVTTAMFVYRTYRYIKVSIEVRDLKK